MEISDKKSLLSGIKRLNTLKLSAVIGFSPSPLERGWGEVRQYWQGFYKFSRTKMIRNKK
jgi:hypothetical protein